MFALNLAIEEVGMLLNGAVVSGPESYALVVKKVLQSVEDQLGSLADDAENCDADAARKICRTLVDVIAHFRATAAPATALRQPAQPDFCNHADVAALCSVVFGAGCAETGRSVARAADLAEECGLSESWDFNCSEMQGLLIQMRVRLAAA